MSGGRAGRTGRRPAAHPAPVATTRQSGTEPGFIEGDDENHHDRRTRALRSQPHRHAAHRQRPDGALQLPVRPAPRGDHGAAHRGHRSASARSAPSRTASSATSIGWACGRTKGRTWAEPYGPYRQSERAPLYEAGVERLLETGWAYPCFCTQERLDALKEEQLGRGEMPKYDRRCLGSGSRGRAAADRRRRGSDRPLPGAGRRGLVRRPDPRAHHLLVRRHRRLHHQAQRRRVRLQLRGGHRRRGHEDHHTSSGARTTSRTPRVR